MKLLHRIAGAYRTYKQVRYLVWALAGLGSLATTLVGSWWVLVAKARSALAEDAPEYAADTPISALNLGLPQLDLPTIPVPNLWPALIVAAVVALLFGLTHIPMSRPDNPFEKDPQRMFSEADRAWIAEAAGHRCEHLTLGIFRCHQHGSDTFPLNLGDSTGQMDHHYPHSRGGATSRHNLVWLCEKHNKRKSNRIPTMWQTWLLTQSRQHYFPAELHDYMQPTGLAE